MTQRYYKYYNMILDDCDNWLKQEIKYYRQENIVSNRLYLLKHFNYFAILNDDVRDDFFKEMFMDIDDTSNESLTRILLLQSHIILMYPPDIINRIKDKIMNFIHVDALPNVDDQKKWKHILKAHKQLWVLIIIQHAYHRNRDGKI